MGTALAFSCCNAASLHDVGPVTALTHSLLICQMGQGLYLHSWIARGLEEMMFIVLLTVPGLH